MVKKFRNFAFKSKFEKKKNKSVDIILVFDAEYVFDAYVRNFTYFFFFQKYKFCLFLHL